MSAEKQAILDKYIKLFHEYHDCLHCLNGVCNDRGKNDRRCCFEGNNLCVSWIENLAQEISALYIKETGQQATNTQSAAIAQIAVEIERGAGLVASTDPAVVQCSMENWARQLRAL
jgi:hypothetical protein